MLNAFKAAVRNRSQKVLYSNSSHLSVGQVKSKSAVSRPRMFLLNVMKTKTPDIQAITAIIELIIGITIKDIGVRLKKDKKDDKLNV